MVEEMRKVHLKSAAEQVADELQLAIRRGDLDRGIPGVKELAQLLDVSHRAVEGALRLLEAEGTIINRGVGKRREVVKTNRSPRDPLTVAILPHEPLSMTMGYLVELKQLLRLRGHRAFFSDRCLLELKMKPARVAKMVRETKSDAWVVIGGSKEVLGWFVDENVRAFALFGRRRDLPLAGAGPDKVKALRVIVRRLVQLGHRRIVLLVQNERRQPQPGAAELGFLNELASWGLSTGKYNLPDWDPGPEGLATVLHSMFQVTPPTAIICDEAYLFHAVKHNLSHRGIEAPRDVSLISTDPDRTFDWCSPSIAHISWNPAPVLRRIINWADKVANGERDIQQAFTDAEFIEGGTVGPCRWSPSLIAPLRGTNI